ncbi:MAG TPA: hypothetical protein VEL77_14985 [Rugosimonospora sp.]|nr:hypothetical protein [Rugosimonospora sp.]
MLLNRHNLNIAALCSKEASRFSLQALYVTPQATVETDGHQLVSVTLAPGLQAESFPEPPNTPKAVDEWKPFLLPASEALAIAKALPKKSKIPALECAAVTDETDGHGHSAISVTDLEFARVFRTRKPEGNFPDYERIMPKLKNATFQVAFDAALLVRVLNRIVAFQQGQGNAKGGNPATVTFSFTDKNHAVRLDAKGGEDQQLTAVVMPCSLPKDSKGKSAADGAGGAQ